MCLLLHAGLHPVLALRRDATVTTTPTTTPSTRVKSSGVLGNDGETREAEMQLF